MWLPTCVASHLMTQRRACLRAGDRDRYKTLNRQVKAAIREDTRCDLQRRIQDSGRGDMWRCIRPVISGKQTPRPTPSADVESMNAYFVNVGVQTARQVDSSGPDMPIRLPRVSTGRFEVEPITPERLFSTVAQMNGSPTCGADGLSMRFLKMCLPSVYHVITHIVNSSLTSHTVPRSWKLTIIHPIQKKLKIYRYIQLPPHRYPSHNRQNHWESCVRTTLLLFHFTSPFLTLPTWFQNKPFDWVGTADHDRETAWGNGREAGGAAMHARFVKMFWHHPPRPAVDQAAAVLHRHPVVCKLPVWSLSAGVDPPTRRPSCTVAPHAESYRDVSRIRPRPTAVQHLRYRYVAVPDRWRLSWPMSGAICRWHPAGSTGEPPQYDHGSRPPSAGARRSLSLAR